MREAKEAKDAEEREAQREEEEDDNNCMETEETSTLARCIFAALEEVARAPVRVPAPPPQLAHEAAANFTTVAVWVAQLGVISVQDVMTAFNDQEVDSVDDLCTMDGTCVLRDMGITKFGVLYYQVARGHRGIANVTS